MMSMVRKMGKRPALPFRLAPLAVLAVVALAGLAMFASPGVGQAQGACADPNDTSCPFGVTPSATHESITVAWVDQLNGANKWQIEVGVGGRSHLVNVQDTIVWSGGSKRIEERTVKAEDVGVARTVSDSYQCEDTYVTEEHVGKYMAVCIVTPPTARVTKSANPFTITNATWPELTIRPDTDHTVRMRAFRDDHEGYIVARSGWSTSHTVRTKAEPQAQGGGRVARPTNVHARWVDTPAGNPWPANLHVYLERSASKPAAGNDIAYVWAIYQGGRWHEGSYVGGMWVKELYVSISCKDEGSAPIAGYLEHIFCTSSPHGHLELAPGVRLQVKAVEVDEDGDPVRSPSEDAWVEIQAPAYPDHWYQVRNVDSVVTNDYVRITWDAPRVIRGASPTLDDFFSVPRRVSYDVLVKTNGGIRTDNGNDCGAGAHVGFDSRYGRVVTFRKGTLKPGCEYLAEITALYSSAITGIPAILGKKAAPGKQLSKGNTQHRFSFTKPQRKLVLKVNGEDQEDGAQVDVSEGSKVTLTADVGGAAPDHGLRIKLVATGTAGSLAGCSTGTGHDWGPGLNCAGDTETANLHIAAGENSASIDLKFHQDAQEDPGETLTLTASYVIRGESDSHSVTFNIEDIYHANKLSVQSSSAREKVPEGSSAPAGIDDTKPVRFLVVLQRSTQETVTVRYRTADGFGDIVGDSNGPATGSDRCLSPASANNSPNRDYVSTSGTLTFGPGETRKHIDVEVCDDTIEDSMEVFRMILSDATNAMITHPKAIGLIINDEAPRNSAPTVASAISDATIPSQSATRQVSLSGVFSDADGDTLTITTNSSSETVATVSVASDQTALTVSAQSSGTTTITVTAKDGNGGSVDDSFDVTVKSVPVVASAFADVNGLFIGDEHEVPVSDVFSDADSDALTITATSSSDAIATAAVAADGSSVNLAAKSRGTATVTVTAQESDGNTVSDAFDVTVVNRAPTVASAIADATIVNESGTHQESLSGMFSDAAQDSLTITAASSNETVATVSVSADYATLTMSAQARGSVTITVTANDGNGGSVKDSFTVTVKATPVVANAIADVSELEVDATHEVSLSRVFSDADGDSLTITAGSSKDAVATVSVAADYSSVTVGGKGEGTATIMVTAQDADGNRVSDAFDVTVVKANNPPTVASAISDATIINESGTHQVSLSGVFSDADSDNLTITAESSSASVAKASVSTDYATLTVSAQGRGTATITVTAADGNGGSVEDTFTVTVKAAPVLVSAIADVSELEIDATHEVSLSSVFSDADRDALTISATTSDSSVVQVSNTIDPSTGSATAITVIGVDAGAATITVTARDSDGNSVNDTFDVTVPAAEQQQAAELLGSVVSLEVIATAENSVVVRWSAPETGGTPDGYIVHLKPENGEKGSGKTKRPKAKKTQVKFNNLQSGQTYQVWVRAQNEAGKGERVHASITLPEEGDGQTGQ